MYFYNKIVVETIMC